LGTHPQDLMVHPDEQGKGIFHAMAEYEKQKVKEKKALFMAGFPLRVPTYSGLKKIGWKDVNKLPVLVYPVRFSGILNRVPSFSTLSLFWEGGCDYFTLFCVVAREKKAERESRQRRSVSLTSPSIVFGKNFLSLSHHGNTR